MLTKKNKLMKTLTFICCMILALGVFAQKGAFGEDIKTEEQKIEEKVGKVTGNKVQRDDPNGTTKSGEKQRAAPNKGKVVMPIVVKKYSVLLFQSEDPIDITHKAMKTYGDKLFYRQIPNDDYYYMVGEFKTQEEANNFLKTVKLDFPQAELVNDIDHPHVKL
jgi:hypothetical protein